MGFENFNAENAWKPESEVKNENLDRLEKIEKKRIEKDWDAIVDELSRAKAAADRLEDAEAFSKIKALDFVTSLRKAVPLCLAETKNATKNIAKNISEYPEFAAIVGKLADDLKQLQLDIVSNAFADNASLKARYDDISSPLRTASELVEKMAEEPALAKAS